MSSSFCKLYYKPTFKKPNNFNTITNGTTLALAKINIAIGQADEIN